MLSAIVFLLLNALFCCRLGILGSRCAPVTIEGLVRLASATQIVHGLLTRCEPVLVEFVVSTIFP